MKKIVVIYLLLFSVTIFAQAPKRFYTKFGGIGIDIGYSVKPTLDRHYIVAGSTSSFGAGNTDVYLVKVDSMGFPIWQKTFGGFNNDVGRSVIQLSDSGYVVAGYTNSYGAGGYDAYIVKTDKNGNFIWQKTFGGLDWDFAYDLVLAADGDIVVCGNTSSSGAGKKDGLLLKYDIFGTLVWQKTIGGAENEELRSVIKTNDNFLATVGYTESNGDIDGDVYFYKFDLSGNTIFYNITGGPGKDYANDIVQNPSTNYVICGAKTYTAPNPIGLTYCMSSTGAFVYESSYTSNVPADEFVSVANSSSLADFSGFVRHRNVPNFKVQVDIYIGNPVGYYYNINASGGSEDEYGYSIETMPDGGYVCVGSTMSFGSIGEDVYMIKVDSAMITYSSVVGVKETVKNNKPAILQNNNKIDVIFKDANVSGIELIDLNGKLVQGVMINENATESELDISDLTAAVYIIRIRFKNSEIYNKKIIKD